MSHPTDWMTRIQDKDVLRLGHAIEAAGLTYRETAERLDVAQITIAFWMTGRFNPSYRNRLKIREFVKSIAEV